MKKVVGTVVVWFIVLGSYAQNIVAPPQQLMIKPKGQIVCYASGESHPVNIPPPIVVNSTARTQTANIQVDYVGFPANAQAVFEEAVAIWENIIQSPVTIHVRAAWVSQEASTLGSAIWGNAFANFDGAPKLNVFYPVALAEKLAGRALNPNPNPTTGDNYDIYAFFNSNQTAWSFTDATTTSQYNFKTVVVHEIGHGLGFTDTYDISTATGLGSFGVQGTTIPIIFDVSVENSGARLLNQANGSTTLATSLTSQSVFYNASLSGPAVTSNIKLYAPSGWQSGSSIAHLDQSTYSLTENRLMRPQLDRGQVTPNPGPIVLNMFADMGWVAPYITHLPLKDSEVTNSTFWFLQMSQQMAPQATR